ncbi:uncharacterized protein LOC119719982 [Patiria miniata]|uniref:Egg coat matrix protein n=1 Tax=Patiria miniata TaxID=46514 RepID=A0A913Z327_PATMI|nr:uncharacterized protein LOC119719982 [Patiria miniata]
MPNIYRARWLGSPGQTMKFAGMWFLCALVLLERLSGTQAAFGDDISQDNEDNRFAVMGQVTKDTFDVQSGNVTLQLNVQDTVGTMDFWLLDFQEYRFNLDALPVDESTGMLMKDRTSACSNVYEDANWDTFFNDSYIQNAGRGSLATKSLFTQIQRGEEDSDGIMRNNKLIFQGDMATFANCKDSSDEEFIWEMTAVTTDEIEYRTKLYATNIRPKDPQDSKGGISFVQSHIELIWRISRSVMAKFLISSTALIRPILEFARVSAVYDDQDRAVPTQSALHIRFRTVVDEDDQMVSYENNSITYIPENVNHGLNTVLYQPVGTLDASPPCNFVLDEGTQTQRQCQQTWEFKMILDIDASTQVDNRVPIDASGTFEFLYMPYRCGLVNLTTLNLTTCVAMSVDPAKISALITIQTTVFVQDEEDDQVTIILHSLTGASNEDLSYGTGSRGVAHKEYVELRVKFSPALLRKDYDLYLLLFMVCKGEEYASGEFLQGCLQAPSTDRYIAHLDASFNYIPRITDENGTVVLLDHYNTSHVQNDYVQNLDQQEYLRTESGETLAIPVHRSTFYNVALSAESDIYTITVVFRLVEAPGRKRRAALPHMQDIVLAKSVVGHAGIGRTTGTIITRHSRDVEDSVQDTHANKIPFLSLGCPEEATHVLEELDCKCPAGMMYDLNSFNCEAASILEDVKEVKNDDQVSDTKETASAEHSACSVLLIVLANSLIFLLLKN